MDDDCFCMSPCLDFFLMNSQKLIKTNILKNREGKNEMMMIIKRKIKTSLTHETFHLVKGQRHSEGCSRASRLSSGDHAATLKTRSCGSTFNKQPRMLCVTAQV